MKTSLRTFLLLASLVVITAFSPRATAQDPLLGEIRMFAGNFAPAGWAFCDGQLLNINDNSALYSILGTTYGGDGETTFALPDLRGRVPVHAGTGPGLTPKSLGEKGGKEVITADPTPPTPVTAPTVRIKTVKKGKSKVKAVSGPARPTPPATPGVDQTNLQPYTGIHFIIALQGIFPS